MDCNDNNGDAYHNGNSAAAPADGALGKQSRLLRETFLTDGPVSQADQPPPACRRRRSPSQCHAERLLAFGRDLSQMSKLLTPYKHAQIVKQRKCMVDAFSLLAYNDPWASPQAQLLSPTQREPVANALNRAILQHLGRPCRPPLEVLVNHCETLRTVMATNGFGSGAFVDRE